MLDRPAAPGPAVGAMTAVNANPFYLNLEALRGICAMIVVLYHVEFETPITENFVVRHGWLFVDFFFVLSGFVIALIHMRAATGLASAKRFLIRRFFRIYPLHLVTMIMVGLLLAGRIAIDPGKAESLGVNAGFGWLALYNLLLIHAWGFVDQMVLNAPSWSISTEWAAYLVTAAIFAILPRPRWRLAALAAIGLGCLAVLAVAGGNELDAPMLYRLPRCLYGFAVGAMVYAASRRFAVFGPRGAFALQCAAIIGTGAILANLDRVPDLDLAFPAVTGVLLLGAVSDRSSPMFRLLTARPAQLLGRLSYSLYMVHVPVIIVADYLVESLVGRNGDGHPALSTPLEILATLGVIALIILVSLATHRWIEMPWRERGRRLAAAG
jgi:peptidoglycan/LPS O-acetylase OafA/YrhL